jgi:hypothetical protein
VSDRLSYERDELVSSHPYVRPHQVDGRLFHGGFIAEGGYVPPRILGRAPATEAWARALVGRGHTLIDCAEEAHPFEVYPSTRQQKFLLGIGSVRPLADALTITAHNEGKGEALCYLPPMDLQALIEEPIAETTTGHLWKGLFWAHGVDEAGDRNCPEEGGHKQMWLAVRDMLFGEDPFPPPEVPPLYSRPKPEGGEMPMLPAPVAKLFEANMALLQVEIRSYRFAQLCVDLCRDPQLFADRRKAALMVADIVDRIVADEASHVAYLQVLFSELRSFTFKGLDGQRHQGADLIDPVWDRLLAWPDEEALLRRWAHSRDQVKADLQARLDPSAARKALEEFDSLASPAGRRLAEPLAAV